MLILTMNLIKSIMNTTIIPYGDKQDPNNYKLISMLSVLSKIFDKTTIKNYYRLRDEQPPLHHHYPPITLLVS